MLLKMCIGVPSDKLWYQECIQGAEWSMKFVCIVSCFPCKEPLEAGKHPIKISLRD